MQNILLEKTGGIAQITINRPHVRNAVNEETMAELHEALNEIERDASLRVVILTGAGDKAFISGGDIKEFEALTTIPQAKAMAETMRGFLNRLESLPLPVIAAVNGHALGGGCETALACDFRIAAENATLGFLQINMGIITGWGSGPRLLRLVGRAQATRLLMLGERISAQEAQRIGLVHEVAPRDEFRQRVEHLAAKLAEKPPLALRGFKQAIHQWSDIPMHAGQVLETEIFGQVWVSEDHSEAVRAVLEKRTPVFRGK